MAHRTVEVSQPTARRIVELTLWLEKTASLKSRRGAKSPSRFTGEARLTGPRARQHVAVLRLICLIVARC